MQSRYYSPDWRRFINADGIFESGHELLGNNLYAYCANNPINYYDPSGEFLMSLSLSTLLPVGTEIFGRKGIYKSIKM